MKEGRIFEYTMEHIPVFRSLFEILSGVLHELVMNHIKPPKPIDAEKQDDSDKEKLFEVIQKLVPEYNRHKNNLI